MKDMLAGLRANTLLVNSMALLAASGAVAGFGFIFWAVVARTFSDGTVGTAATLLSLSSLISLLSLAGFDSTFVRFLPGSERRSDYINSGLAIAALLSVIISAGFVAAFPLIAPDLAFVTYNPFYFLYFVLFTVFTTLNTLTNAVFLAFREALFILGINIAFSATKVVLPFIMNGGDAMMIFVISGISQVVGVGLSLAAIVWRFQHRFSPHIHLDILKLAKKYAFAVYGSSLLNLLPPTILPLVVTANLGSEAAAYYYMSFTIATLLYTVAYATNQSVFAEGSHNEKALKQHLIKGAKIVSLLLIPSAVALALAAPYILQIFGENYARSGAPLLQVFCASAILVAVYSALGAIFKVRGAIGALWCMNIAYVAAIGAASYLLTPAFGLLGIGYAWALGNALAIVAGVSAYAWRSNHKT